MTIAFEETVLQLRQITGLSPLNPRQDMESDVSGLAAFIAGAGLLQPLLLRAVESESAFDFDYQVLDGGRRWRALKSLGDDARIISVRIVTGTDAEALEATIAAAEHERLHPIQEYEAFVRLIEAGRTEEQVAHFSGLTVRQVRQRLALGDLADCVKAAYRADEFGAEIAKAFASGAKADQERVFAIELQAEFGRWTNARRIRIALRSEAMEASDPIAKFLLAKPLRITAYEAEGGAVKNDLFEEETYLDNAAAAQRAAQRLLLAEAENIAETEGWGGASATTERPKASDPDPIDAEPDYTEAEETRLDALISEGQSTHSPSRLAEIAEEEDDIFVRALLRAISVDRRATLGVRVQIDHQGALEIIRAVPLAAPREEPQQPAPEAEPTPANAASKQKSDKAAKEQAAPRAALPPAPSKEAGEYLTEALENALKAEAAQNMNVALALAIAALGSTPHQQDKGVTIANSFALPSGQPPRAELLVAIAGERFEIALARCAAAPMADLTAAFQELTARALWLNNPPEPLFAALLTFAAPLGGNIAARLRDALDYERYMLALPREELLAVIRALEGEATAAECGKWKKQTLAPRAARTAREKGWLPERLLAPLEEVGAETGASIAQVIAATIGADEYSHTADAIYAEVEAEEKRIEAAEEVTPASWADDVNRSIRGEQDMPILADFLIRMFHRSETSPIVGRGDFRTGLRKFGKDANPNFKLPDDEALAAALAPLGVAERKEGAGARKVVFYSGIDWNDP